MNNGCGSSVIENMAGVSKRRNGVSFTSGEASMRMRVDSQSARCLTRVSGDKFYVGLQLSRPSGQSTGQGPRPAAGGGIGSLKGL